jgi:predicted nucleic acid-binding protein
MNIEVFNCLRDAVILARDQQIKTAATLRAKLRIVGYSEDTITEALNLWADYEVRKAS